MKRVGIAGLSLVASLVMCTIVVASAPAAFKEEPPEYGQCLPKPFKGVGRWKDAGCNIPRGPGLAEHKYEWYPWFGASVPGSAPSLVTKRKFTSRIKAGTLAVLAVDHLETVTCAGETAKGEITGPKTVGGMNVIFTGCTEVVGNTCQGAGQPAGRIETNSLVGELGIIQEVRGAPTRNRVGLVLFLEGMEFECVGIPVDVRGSVIHPIVTNLMSLRSTERFTGTKGEQVPKSFAFVGSHEQQPAFIADLAPEDVLETSIAGGPFYRSSLSLTTVQSYEMKIEISSIN